ncbi:hypothetical protein LGH70_04520 [Hymenobacter sp. BT635]|uniref:Uncharacterized protein n=1 Tax=Hymenobacter nitidus TaxID=2880929 RepID=A0ABS8A971_9BACT|nr:hypothetical protein [Hymenobacter nitidus]MCB2376831.1 hypothetical protein [Hymenobacter nitidus]
MKVPRYLLLLLLTGLFPGGHSAHAQRTYYVQEFAGSTVLLTNGDTLQGALSLHHSEDVVRITFPDNTMSTLSAVAIESFAVKGEKQQRRSAEQYDFFDARQGYYYGVPWYSGPGIGRQIRRGRVDAELVRVYRTYRWNHDNDYSDFKSPGFFEQLSSGPNVLLRREVQIEKRAYMGPGGYGAAGAYSGTYVEIDDKFYLGMPNGNVLPLRSPRKDLLAIFRQQAKQIEKYAKDNRLNFTEAKDLAFIVNYANSLQKDAK